MPGDGRGGAADGVRAKPEFDLRTERGHGVEGSGSQRIQSEFIDGAKRRLNDEEWTAPNDDAILRYYRLLVTL